ncbi:non-ribosomal peptide synthetase [Bacillus cereus]|uniref:non-ribosomal peptide synthetase n=1 Tax=Bacillus cereus TaxID=1396 RepID=UPI00027A8E49|nr:non-ribosomal peptide synthetase [Bacillus cereus]EJS62882.1 amino acid adenylation domain-containing protein [Bacillus cereus BAG2X1-1]EJS69806.1 amino acid adenylation domain-containing protein [Bacillus cereus BAG2X1-3]
MENNRVIVKIGQFNIRDNSISEKEHLTNSSFSDINLTLDKSLVKKIYQKYKSISHVLFAAFQVFSLRVSCNKEMVFNYSNNEKTGDSLFVSLNGDINFDNLVNQIEEYNKIKEVKKNIAYTNEIKENTNFNSIFIGENANIDINEYRNKFDLLLYVRKKDINTISLHFNLNTDIIDTSLIINYLDLLKNLVNNPTDNISGISILSKEDEKKVLYDWNSTYLNLDTEKCMHELLEEQAKKTPERIAIVYKDKTISFGNLNKKANQLANYLKKSGVSLESLVAINLDRSIEMFVGLFAILKAGGAYVPLDPEQPIERQKQILNGSKISTIITNSRYITHELDNKYNLICLDVLEDDLNHEYSENPKNKVDATNLAYVIHTSGSSGIPKGVAVEHRSVFNLFCAENESIFKSMNNTCLKISLNAPIVFDASVQQILTLFNGHTLYVIPNDTRRNPDSLIDFIRQNQLDVFDCTPSHLKILLKRGLLSQNEYVPGVFKIGGEPIDEKLWKELSCISRSTFLNLYGPTECTVNTTLSVLKENTYPNIGRPLSNVKTYILDNNLVPVPIGQVGELYIGGKGLARGYINNNKLTNDSFIPNPFCEGELIYKTGDLVKHTPDSNIIYLGRSDSQIKINGYRIELNEINEKIKNNHLVKDSHVLINELDNGIKKIAAFIIPKDATYNITEIKQYLKDFLPDYMLPTKWVEVDHFPININGKIDKEKLLQMGQEDIPYKNNLSTTNNLVHYVKNLWGSILEVGYITEDTDFFEVGGDSISLIQVLSRVKEDFKVDIPIRFLFENSTIKKFSEILELNIKNIKEENNIQDSVKLSLNSTEDSLSYAQKRLWFLDKMDENNSIYNEFSIFKLDGELDIKTLEKSVNEIIKRHDSLRTTFMERNGEPFQVVKAYTMQELSLVDLSDIELTRKDSVVKEYIMGEINQPFNLEKGPLIRFKVLKTNVNSFIFLITVHHIIFDGWSNSIFLKELSNIYYSLLNNTTCKLPTLPMKYSEYNIWKEMNFKGTKYNEQLNFWKEKLSGKLPILDIPTDKSRGAKRDIQGSRERLKLDPILVKKFKKFKTTPFMNFLAAFNVLLNRYSNQSDLLIGSPIANRNHINAENLIGFFVNTLVFRADLSGDPTFLELLEQIKEYALDAYSNQDLPFEKLVEELNPQRDLSHTPIFQAMFVYQNMPKSTLEFPNIVTSHVDITKETAKFDLTLFIEEINNEVWASIEYNSNLFSKETIIRMINNFQCLLQSIVSNPTQKISSLAILSSEDKSELLKTWQRKTIKYDLSKCVHERFEDQVKITPKNIAVECNGKKLTYEELNKKANQFAHYLLQSGIRNSSIVSIHLERSIDLMVSILGTLKAGAAYNLIDIKLPYDRVKYMVEDSNSNYLVINNGDFHELQDINIISLKDMELVDFAIENPQMVYSNLNTAYINYTSGSTGKPKGVIITHKSLMNYLQWSINEYGVTEGFGSIVHSSISFDATITVLITPLLVGKKVLLISDEVNVSQLGKILINNPGASILKMTPSHLKIINEVIPPTELKNITNTLVIGGEQLTYDLVKVWQKHAPQTAIINEYGPTETVVGCCTYTLSQQEQYDVIPIGNPIDNMKLYVLDKNLEPLPVGIPGELYIGGVGVGEGYINKKHITNEKFINNPFSEETGDKLYKTGDIVKYTSDGNFWFIGRVDDQIKVRGHRVELGEIEKTIKSHPSITDVVVKTIKSSSEENEIVVYLKTKDKHSFSQKEIVNYLKTQLPEYMIPTKYMVIEKFKLTNNGKIDVGALPEFVNTELNSLRTTVPRNEYEQSILYIWKDVLDLASIDIRDNFFQIGGHSLLAIKVATNIKTIFNIEMPVIKIFEKPTIEMLAEEVIKIMNQSPNRSLGIKKISREQFRVKR